MTLHERDLAAALPLWPHLQGAALRLLNHSENHTFLLETRQGERFTLRVHRPDYQNPASIESELAWLTALRHDTDLPIPEPVPGQNGALLQQFATPAGERRHAVLFRFIAGREPRIGEDLTSLFKILGDYAAQLHNHVASWKRPAGFARQAWSAATILEADGLWGDWRVAPGVTPEIRAILDRLDRELCRRLAAYGQGPERYGLVHADMRLGNLLVDGKRVSLIDFDDCGFCWFAYDFAAAVSFHETHNILPELKDFWLEGYGAHRRLTAADIAAIDSMVLLRRMALLAWIGSHGETDLAQNHRIGFAEGTAMLAERYLKGPLWP